MKTIENISISKNRVAVELSKTTVQFVIWDLTPQNHENLKNQLKLAFNICGNFKEIVKHLFLNGFEAELEDIY